VDDKRRVVKPSQNKSAIEEKGEAGGDLTSWGRGGGGLNGHMKNRRYFMTPSTQDVPGDVDGCAKGIING